MIMKKIIFFFLVLIFFSCSDNQIESSGELPAKIQIKKNDETICIQKGNQKILEYQIKSIRPLYSAPAYYERSGFIRKAFSPNGQILTDDFPVGHAHQHSIFMAWVNTRFKGEKVDFWNQHKETGTVKHVKVISTSETDSTASFQVELQHISLKHGPVLKENWTITAYDKSEDYFLWEIQSVQENITSDTLFVDDYKYGGLGVRGTKHWNSDDSLVYQNEMKVLTSENHNRVSANHVNPNWVAMYGEIDNKTCGLALVDHATNFNYPQMIRVHPEMPYFCKAPMIGNPFVLAPGVPYTSKYQIITFDSNPSKDLINQISQEFNE